MKLYIKPGACSLATHIALQEAGLPCAIEVVDLKTKRTDSGGDYTTINPLGYVPALQLDSGEVLTEVPTILQYIADQAPTKQLAPAYGTLERYRMQSWLVFVGTEMHRAFGPFFNPGASEDWKTFSMARLKLRLAHVDRQLAGKDYLAGAAYSVADAYLYTVTNWTFFIKLDLTPWPNLAAHHARVGARPATKAALKAEGIG